jgi:hypothetical protein
MSRTRPNSFASGWNDYCAGKHLPSTCSADYRDGWTKASSYPRKSLIQFNQQKDTHGKGRLAARPGELSRPPEQDAAE